MSGWTVGGERTDEGEKVGLKAKKEGGQKR